MAKKVDVVRETCTRYNCCPSGKSLPQDLQRSRTKLIRSKVELIARNFQKKEIHGINVLQKNKPHNVLQLLKWFFLLEEMDIKTRRGWLSCVNRLSCLINIACLTCKPKCCFRSQSPSKGDSCLFVCLFVSWPLTPNFPRFCCYLYVILLVFFTAQTPKKAGNMTHASTEIKGKTNHIKN